MRSFIFFLFLASPFLSQAQNSEKTIKQYWTEIRNVAPSDSAAAATLLVDMTLLVETSDSAVHIGMLNHAHGYIEEFHGSPIRAVPLYEEALKHFEDAGNIRYAGEAAKDLAFVCHSIQENKRGIGYSARAIDMFREAADTVNLLGAYSNHGRFNHLFGDLDSALVSFYMGIDIISIYEVPDKHVNEFKKATADLYNNLGITYLQKLEVEQAISYYKKALVIRVEQADTVQIANLYLNIGGVYFENEDYGNARLYLDSASVIYEDKGHIPGVVLCKTNGGSIANLIKKYDQAIEYAQSGLELSESIGDKASVAYNYNNLGVAHGYLGDGPQSDIYFDSAIAVARRLDSKIILLEVEDARYNLESELGNYQDALTHRNSFIEYQNKMTEEEKTEAIAELETKYETLEKENQIVQQKATIAEQEVVILRDRFLLLTSIFALILLLVIGVLWRNRLKKKQQIVLQQERLKAKEAEINATVSSQEKERARYARDLHDGFGQMISILNRNLDSLRNNATPDKRYEVFEESEKLINEMYDELRGICFDLMPHTLVNKGLESGLEEFAERVNKTGDVFIEINFFGLDQRLSEIQEISLYRITQEWINNSLKHSDADKITLQITKDAEEITLLIEDNGSGFDKGLLINSKGNGWKNLNLRSDMIGGILELETEYGKRGNTLILNAPVNIETLISQKNTISMV